jgi:hypothetical protein
VPRVEIFTEPNIIKPNHDVQPYDYASIYVVLHLEGLHQHGLHRYLRQHYRRLQPKHYNLPPPLLAAAAQKPAAATDPLPPPHYDKTRCRSRTVTAATL